MVDSEYTKKELTELICEVMGIDSITTQINRHIAQMVLQDDMTYKEIARCIVWYTEVKGKKLDVLYGLKHLAAYKDIVNKYFKQLELDQLAQKEDAKKVVEYQDNNIIFNISSLKHKKRTPKQLDIRDINIKGDNDNND